MRQLTGAAAAMLIAAGTVLPLAPAAADRISDGQWYVKALDLRQAHQHTQGRGVLVAVIDTGIDATHPDIAGSVIPGADTSRLGPGNGLSDDSGHGTAMAGLIVGHGQIRGVAPEATVMSIRAETAGGGSPTAIGAALSWAVDHGAHVVSISLASPDGDQVLEAAVDKALARNVVVVAGAGNTNLNQRVGYPAAYPGVVAVGGVRADGSHSPAAVSGSQIALSAPCDKISTPYLKHGRAVGTGTSNSAALVAGAAALVRAKFPQLSARDVIHRLTATAVDRGPPGHDPQFGHGMLDIVAALTGQVALLPPQPNTATPSPSFTTSVPIAAPGAQFPTALALLAAAACLLLVMAGAGVWLMLARRHRTPRMGGMVR